MPRKTTAPNAGERQSRNTRLIIGRRIAHRRAVLGMSQSKLADEFGVSPSTLAQAEVGLADLNAGDLIFLGEILDVPVTYFFLDEFKVDSGSRLEFIISYLVRLPPHYQQLILHTTRATFMYLRGRDVRPIDEIDDFDNPVDETASRELQDIFSSM